ncbi:MAG: M67 family metallopeptidase [Actinobacteria bacterium]|nr:M67 family metallopeptidase [Actinomycetota bacterium]
MGDVSDATHVSETSEILEITPEVHDQMCALALAEYPLEACGLMAGEPGRARVTRFFPCRNIEKSARIYTLDPKDHLRAERTAEDAGLEIMGVMHSHTHSEAYPSATDVAAAPDPAWHYLIVTLKREKPEVRSYRIVAGAPGQAPGDAISEVRVTVSAG